MTTDDIERMAREAGLTDPDLKPWMTDYGNAEKEIKRFAAAVRAQALEDAAKIVDAAQPMGRIAWTAAEIRALKDKP